jgi:hypothetical protein
MTRKPVVFKSRTRQDWITVYRTGQAERFPTWREAFDHAFAIARVRQPISREELA